MKEKLRNIANLLSGVYLTNDVQPDTYYLQGNHFNEDGLFDITVKPQILLTDKTRKYLLLNDDILFAAKGLNNYAVVYKNEMGSAVASSSFIIIRIDANFRSKLSPQYLAWYLSNNKELISFRLQTGTTIPSISIKFLLDLEIRIPEIEKQMLILNIQQLHNQEMKIMKQLATLKNRSIKDKLLKEINQIKYE
jgi:restriction endonuclease S subunit